MILHIVHDIASSREFLSNTRAQEVIIMNSQSSVYCYGIRVVYCIMQNLESQFAAKRIFIVINTDYLYSAFIMLKREHFTMIDTTPYAVNYHNIDFKEFIEIKTIIENCSNNI